jgi:hypothetical protein
LVIVIKGRELMTKGGIDKKTEVNGRNVYLKGV